MTPSRYLAILACGATLAACSKDAVQVISGPLSGANVKFYNFSLGAPGVNFFVNDAQVTALRSDSGATTKNGTTYGGVAAGGLYTAVPSGQVPLTGRIGTVTDAGVAIATVATALADGKYYSMYLSGAYNTTTKKSDAFIIEDALPAWDYANANVRFVNTIANAPSPMILWVKSRTVGDSVAIGAPAGIGYKGATGFVPIRGDAYDLTVRYPGSNTAVITRTEVSFGVSRVYTISTRGDITITSTTAANRPFLDNTTNR
ncbi:MAG: DUF4397 domain-containing protein [Gemmatimonadaceae bacterium]